MVTTYELRAAIYNYFFEALCFSCKDVASSLCRLEFAPILYASFFLFFFVIRNVHDVAILSAIIAVQYLETGAGRRSSKYGTRIFMHFPGTQPPVYHRCQRKSIDN